MTALAVVTTRRLALGGPTLRVGVLSTGLAARDRHNGALLGVEEAQHAAELFGGRAELVAVDTVRGRIPPLTAVLGDDSLATSLALAKVAGADRLFMNVACSSDDLRGGQCSAFTFHVAPSDGMTRDARAQTPGAGDVVAWDGSLVRFGADTLNDRFRKRFGTSMNSASWASWFAVKALWESSLRMKTTDARQLAEYLTRDTTQFDGHKGRPLSFRAWDHQLRQFVYARVGAKLTDVPQSASPETTSRQFLDKLGADSAASACRLVP
ncbi:MAG TPA: hypothetical protein VK636_02425 [Gemmatimonadaceae bacterium]|nr:hypothetical protein [Gemmatimonadaceae bacterium]